MFCLPGRGLDAEGGSAGGGGGGGVGGGGPAPFFENKPISILRVA